MCLFVNAFFAEVEATSFVYVRYLFDINLTCTDLQIASVSWVSSEAFPPEGYFFDAILRHRHINRGRDGLRPT